MRFELRNRAIDRACLSLHSPCSFEAFLTRAVGLFEGLTGRSFVDDTRRRALALVILSPFQIKSEMPDQGARGTGPTLSTSSHPGSTATHGQSVGGRFKAIRSIGKGAHGFVQLALDKLHGDRPVAIKYIPRGEVGNNPGPSAISYEHPLSLMIRMPRFTSTCCEKCSTIRPSLYASIPTLSSSTRSSSPRATWALSWSTSMEQTSRLTS